MDQDMRLRIVRLRTATALLSMETDQLVADMEWFKAGIAVLTNPEEVTE